MTERERRVLEALLWADAAEAEPLRQQVNALQVVGRCQCGCPTIEFAHREGGGLRVVAEATVAESHDSILLFATEQNDLASLEYVGVGDTTPAEFPPPENLVAARTR